jgi:cytoskeletal protein CcmA (bactofilin family)
MARETLSFIGEDAEFSGKLFTKGPIRINGKFEGDLKAEGLIQIGPTGKVKTHIVGRKIVVEGSLLGNITASEDVVITETGRVMGDITTPNLQLGKGVVVTGKINITGGQPKNSKQLLNEVFEPSKKAPAADADAKKKKK